MPMCFDEPAYLLRLSDQLYALYVQPLERAHAGDSVAVSADGRVMLAPDLVTLADKAVAHFGPGSFAFKVGEKPIGKFA